MMKYAIETLTVDMYRLIKERREMSEEFLVSGASDAYVQKGKLIRELKEAIDILGDRREKAVMFVEHLQDHLKPGEKVICTICGKTIDEIYEGGDHEEQV